MFTSAGSLRCAKGGCPFYSCHPPRKLQVASLRRTLARTGGSNRDGPLNRSSHMALPVLCGPNRCALVYSQDRQPLIELSLRVNLPVVELLRALSQVAPRAAEPAPPRSSLAQPRGNPNYDSGPKEATAKKQEKLASSTWAEWYPNSEWQPAPGQHSSGARHSWETCPPRSLQRMGPTTSQLCAKRRTDAALVGAY